MTDDDKRVVTQCQGGFCGSREDCRHYFAASIKGREPANRLCGEEEEPEPLTEREKLLKKFPILQTWDRQGD